MDAAAPVAGLLSSNLPEISLVNQRGGLERLPWLLRGHPGDRELPQLAANERQQFGRSLRHPGRGGIEEVSDVGDGG